MADFDQAVQNLERFIGLLVNATSAVGQVEDHVEANGKAFGDLEQEAEGEGGVLNDRLEELSTTLGSEEAEAIAALDEVKQAASEAEQVLAGVDSKMEQAASDLDQTAGAAEAALEQASTQLHGEGFEPFIQALDVAQQELEASTQEAVQELAALVAAAGGFAAEVEASGNAAAAELEEAASTLADGENAIEQEAREAVQAFTAAADALDDACGVVVSDVGQIYDHVDQAVAAEGQEWDRAVDAAVQAAFVFVSEGRQQRLEPSASMVQEEAFALLSQEYEALETVLDAAARPLGELEPLSVEMERARSVVGQIDELMSALG
jgi:hypothetical protein